MNGFLQILLIASPLVLLAFVILRSTSENGSARSESEAERKRRNGGDAGVNVSSPDLHPGNTGRRYGSDRDPGEAGGSDAGGGDGGGGGGGGGD